MSQAASQAHAFYRDVAKHRTVWTIKDKDGFPAPKNASGQRSQPFWSSCSRVKKIIASVPAYADFSPFEITWDDFCSNWVPGLEQDNMQVGVNWSGPRALGYDMPARDVQRNVEYAIARMSAE